MTEQVRRGAWSGTCILGIILCSMICVASAPLSADEFRYDLGDYGYDAEYCFRGHYLRGRRGFGGSVDYVPWQLSVPHYVPVVPPAPPLNAALNLQRKLQFYAQYSRQQANMASLVERKHRHRQAKLMLIRSRGAAPLPH